MFLFSFQDPIDVWYRICCQRKGALREISMLELSMQIVLANAHNLLNKRKYARTPGFPHFHLYAFILRFILLTPSPRIASHFWICDQIRERKMIFMYNDTTSWQRLIGFSKSWQISNKKRNWNNSSFRFEYSLMTSFRTSKTAYPCVAFEAIQ